MSRERQIVTAMLTLTLLFAAVSGPVAVRLLRQPGTFNGTWRIVALGADLASVLSLALIAVVGGYWLSQPESEPGQ